MILPTTLPTTLLRAATTALFTLLLGGCERSPPPQDEHADHAMSAPSAAIVKLSEQQIADAGIIVVRPIIGGEAASIDVSASIEADPGAVQVVSAAIDGRAVSLARNLGERVTRGETLAIIQSRQAASLNAEVEAARARAGLAQSNLRREQRLFAEKVSAEQDLIAARTAATEADIALRLAGQQLAATGGAGGGWNRIAVRAPMSGQIIARSATLGQSVTADAELFRIADLSRLTLGMALSPADVGRVRPGSQVVLTAPGRRQEARVTFVSPVLDESTRLVRVLAALDNRQGLWRAGETANAAILVAATGEKAIAVPSTAVQMIGDKPFVFVRTADGFRASPVTLGATLGENVAIASGLAGRERVASTNSFVLKAELQKGEAGHED